MAIAAAQDAIVVMGEIAGSYGVRGWIKVRPFAESPEALLRIRDLVAQAARGTRRGANLQRLEGRMHSGALVVALDGVGHARGGAGAEGMRSRRAAQGAAGRGGRRDLLG